MYNCTFPPVNIAIMHYNIKYDSVAIYLFYSIDDEEIG